jgi:pimeloyl-ACP methyl ester carboxylesterase
MTSETIEIAVPGGNIVAEVAGTGPPILFVHGWTLDRRSWRPQLLGLAGSFRIMAIDRRGSGASASPGDMTREVDDLCLLLDTLGLSRVAVVGMSQGTRVALALASRHPDRVDALVLQGAPLPYAAADFGSESEAIPIDMMRSLAIEGRMDDLRRLWLTHPLMQIGASPYEELLRSIVADYPASDLLSISRSAEIEPADLARISRPALLITGEKETIYRQDVARRLLDILPDARHLVIAGAYHLCNLSHPKQYNSAISSFFKRAARPA